MAISGNGNSKRISQTQRLGVPHMPFASSRRRVNWGIQFLPLWMRQFQRNLELWDYEVLSRFSSVRSVTPDHWYNWGYVSGMTEDGIWVQYKHLIHGVGLAAVRENEMQRTARNDDIAYMTHMLQHILHIGKLTQGLVDPAALSMRVGNLLTNYPPDEFDEAPQHLELIMKAFAWNEPPSGENTVLECYCGHGQTLPDLDVDPYRVVFQDGSPFGIEPQWLIGPDQKHRCMIIKANADLIVGIDFQINSHCNIAREHIYVKRKYLSEFDLLNPLDVQFEDNNMERVEMDEGNYGFLLEGLEIPVATNSLIRGVYLHFHCQRPDHGVVDNHQMVQIHGGKSDPWTADDHNDGTVNPNFPDMTYMLWVVDDRVSQYMAHLDTMIAVVLGTHKRVGAKSPFSRWEIDTEIIAHIVKSLEPPACFEVCYL